MGQVISLTFRTRVRERDAPPAGGAQVVFFMGVRYCRGERLPKPSEEAQEAEARSPDAESPHGGGKKRKRRARA